MSPKKLQTKSRYDSLDLDNDGIVSDEEIEKADRILERDESTWKYGFYFYLGQWGRGKRRIGTKQLA